MPVVAGFQDALVRVQSRIGGQQRRVDIQNSAFVMIDEPGAEDAHEPRQNDEVWPVFIETGGKRAIERFAVGESAMLDAGGLDPGVAGTLQAVSIRPITDYERQINIQVASRRAIDKRLQVSP